MKPTPIQSEILNYLASVDRATLHQIFSHVQTAFSRLYNLVQLEKHIKPLLAARVLVKAGRYYKLPALPQTTTKSLFEEQPPAMASALQKIAAEGKLDVVKKEGGAYIVKLKPNPDGTT